MACGARGWPVAGWLISHFLIVGRSFRALCFDLFNMRSNSYRSNYHPIFQSPTFISHFLNKSVKIIKVKFHIFLGLRIFDFQVVL